MIIDKIRYTMPYFKIGGNKNAWLWVLQSNKNYFWER
jgi:hypothetical protein